MSVYALWLVALLIFWFKFNRVYHITNLLNWNSSYTRK